MKKGTLVNFSTFKRPVRLWGLGTVLTSSLDSVRLEIDLTRFDWDVVKDSPKISEFHYNTIKLLIKEKIVQRENSCVLVTVGLGEVWEYGKTYCSDEEQQFDLEMNHSPSMRWALAEILAGNNLGDAIRSLDAVEANCTGATYEDVPYICPKCQKITVGSYWGGSLHAKCVGCDIHAMMSGIKIIRKNPAQTQILVQMLKRKQEFLFAVNQ